MMAGPSIEPELRCAFIEVPDSPFSPLVNHVSGRKDRIAAVAFEGSNPFPQLPPLARVLDQTILYLEVSADAIQLGFLPFARNVRKLRKPELVGSA